MRLNILVLDVGTGSMRGTVLDESAKVLFRQQHPYQPEYREDGTVEQPPLDWLSAAKALCNTAAAEVSVDAVGLTAQRSSVIPADEHGMPLTNAIMWQDTRNRALCEELRDREALVRTICGNGINTVYSGGKMAWLRQSRPDAYKHAAHLFVIPDYLLYHMTGKHVTDHTYGSRSMLMNLRRRSWSPELLTLFGIDQRKLGELIPPSTVAGRITERFAEESGLRAGIPVVSCGGDQQCGAVGQGVFAPGTVSVNMGTGAYLIAPVHHMPEEPKPGLTYSASAVPGEYILESSVLTCGAALNWFLRELDGDLTMVKTALTESPPGANGVIALPYFQGRANPDWNSGARAAFFGLSLGTTKLDLLRAMLEGICIEIARNVETMERIHPIHTIRLSGGLSRTAELGQLLSEVTGIPVTLSDDSDATTMGAWMSAARCLGVVQSWQEAWDMVCPVEKRCLYPRPEQKSFYAQQAAQMEHIYSATMK